MKLSCWEIQMRKRKRPILKNELDNLIMILRERYTCFAHDYTDQLVEALEETKRRFYKGAKRYRVRKPKDSGGAE